MDPKLTERGWALRTGTYIKAVFVCAVCAGTPVFAQTPLTEANHAIQQPDIVTKPESAPRRKVQIENNADSTPVVPKVTDDGIFIGAVNVEGAADIPSSAFAPVIEPFMGKKLTTADLRELSHAVANVARAKGYSFASAYIPPQELAMGVLRVVVDEGVVSAIRLNGSTNKQLRATFNKLVDHAPTIAEIEKQVFLASDIPGVTLQKIGFVREGGKGVLVVDVSEKRVKGIVSVDNNGTSELGPVRVNLSVDVASLLVGGDVLSVAAVTTPVNPKELAFVALKYALPIDADGTVLSFSASYGHTQPGGSLAPYDVLGRSVDLAMAVSHPIIRGRTASLWVSGGFDYLSSSQDVIGTRVNDDKLATVWLSLSGNTELLHGRLRSELTLTQGLPIFNATWLGDPLASRANASGVFTNASFAAEWSGTLTGPVSLRVAERAQLASGPLLSAQQLTLGGSSFGRGFEMSSLSGDEGVLGVVELRSDIQHPIKWIDWAQPYIFVDGGKVLYLGGDPGGGTLLSAGGGLRTRLGKTYVNFESAFPLTANPVENDDHKPRFNFQVTKAF